MPWGANYVSWVIYDFCGINGSRKWFSEEVIADLIVHLLLGVAEQTESGCMCVNPLLGLLIAHCHGQVSYLLYASVFCLQCRDNNEVLPLGIVKRIRVPTCKVLGTMPLTQTQQPTNVKYLISISINIS